MKITLLTKMAWIGSMRFWTVRARLRRATILNMLKMIVIIFHVFIRLEFPSIQWQKKLLSNVSQSFEWYNFSNEFVLNPRNHESKNSKHPDRFSKPWFEMSVRAYRGPLTRIIFKTLHSNLDMIINSCLFFQK